MKAPDKRKDLTQGKTFSHLLRMTAPMILGMFGVITFNLVDTYFVSLLGIHELAALSFTFPIIMFVGSISIALGTGTSIVVSKAIGRKDADRAARLTTDGLFLAIVVVTLISFAGSILIVPLFHAMNASDKLMPLIHQYMQIWFAGTVFLVVPMVGNGAIRATGDTKTPALIMLFSMLVNAALDPLFIFGGGPIPAMGLRGAAIATVFGRMLTFFAAITVLHFREHLIRFTGIKQFYNSWKKILAISIPAAGTNLITPLSTAVITRLTANFGPVAVAALGVANKVESFSMAPVMALSSVLGPLIGQNYGAGHSKRVQALVQQARLVSFLWGTFICLVILIGASSLLSLFSESSSLKLYAEFYLIAVSLSAGLAGSFYTGNSSLNSLGHPLQATLFAFIRMFILYIPLAWISSKYFGVFGIFSTAGVAAAISGILSWIWLETRPKNFLWARQRN